MAFSHPLAANTKDETVEHTSELLAKPHRPLLVQIKYYNMSSSMSDSVKDLITEQQPHENDTIMKNDLIPVSVCVCVSADPCQHTLVNTGTTVKTLRQQEKTST